MRSLAALAWLGLGETPDRGAVLGGFRAPGAAVGRALAAPVRRRGRGRNRTTGGRRPRTGRARLREAEVHLFLERIDLGDLDADLIAEPDDAAGAAADEVVAAGIKDEEVIGHRGERDEPAHGEPRHIDEKAEVAHVGDEGGIGLGLAGAELGLEEGEQLDVLAVALGVGGVAFRHGDVVGDLAEGRSSKRARWTTRSA
jgi:hypothetical protein